MKFIYFILPMILFAVSLNAQDNEKNELRKNSTVKEWNTDATGKRSWLDNQKTYNNAGFKIEEIEFAVYGQKERITYEYDALGKCIKEVVYDDKNKVSRIRKYEYQENGLKKVQYNYLPNGKLFSRKRFEYTQKK